MKHLPRSAAVFAVVGAALSAHAQCSYDIGLVPDFDQRRLGALPGDGGMYCVPTSVTNWFAYFANRGIPQPGTLDGPRNWQSNFNYDRVSNTLLLMGGFMGTTAANGTTGSGGLAGASVYALLFTQNKVTVSHYWCGGGFCPTPNTMAAVRLMGGYVAPCYGHYTLSGAGNYTRNGGHCITAVGQTGCSNGSQLKFRDPASDSTNSSQSTFVTHYATMVPVAANFRSNSNQSYTFSLRWKLDYGTHKFLDGWFVLWPKVALTASPNFVNIQFIRPFPLLGASLPTVQTFPAPAGGGQIMAMAMHPQNLHVFYATMTAGIPGKMWRLDPDTGMSTEVLTGNFNLMAFNRHDELFASQGQIVRSFNLVDSFPIPQASHTLPAVPECIAFDDFRDTIGVLLPSSVATRKQFVRLPRDLTGPLPGGGFLPGAAATIIGDTSMDFKPGSDELYIAGSGAPTIHIVNAAAGGLAYQGGISLPPGSMPTEINVDEQGHVLYVSNGVVHEIMRSATGAWVPNPDSIFEGRPANFFRYVKSRTNHDPLLHEGPSFYNLISPEVPAGFPDCYANCDFSTTPPILNVADFGCFLGKFAAGNPDANCDFSTSPPVLNVADFSCYLAAFAAGCP